MNIRTLYFKVNDIDAATRYWETVLQVKPHKNHASWREFWCGNIRLGLLLNDFGDQLHGSGCVPVFEFDDAVLEDYVQRALKAGATMLIDGRDDPNMKSVLLRDPFGHECEFSRFHDTDGN